MRITDIGPKQKQRHMALIAMETTTHADGGIRDRWDSYRCTRTCYKSESCSFTAPKHDYPLPPCPIFPTCVYGAMHQIVPQFINHAASHLWRGPKRISVAYFILTICVCYVFHRGCDILSRRSFNIMWEDDRANIDGTFLNIYIDDSPDVGLFQDASPKRNAEMLFWDLSCTSGQGELFFSFVIQPAQTHKRFDALLMSWCDSS